MKIYTAEDNERDRLFYERKAEIRRRICELVVDGVINQSLVNELAKKYKCSRQSLKYSIDVERGVYVHKYDVCQVNSNRARARKYGVPENFTHKDWAETKARYGNKCAICHEAKPLTIDHIIPLSKGGKHEPSNIQPLCDHCNKKKGVK